MIAQLEVPDKRQQLGALLRQRRTRIHSEARALGPYLRLPSRIGKAVTQEEVAEAADISRQWYVYLESGRSMRVSPGVLGRIADTLMLDQADRSSLFELAVPELRVMNRQPQTNAVLDAFASIRSLARRLWTATTEQEALAIVREHCMAELKPDAIATVVRDRQGLWNAEATGSPNVSRRWDRFYSWIDSNWPQEIRDEMLCHPSLAAPGETITWSEHPTPSRTLAADFCKMLDSVDLSHDDFMCANVRTRSGLYCRITTIYGARHFFTEDHRALMSAIADLVSFAISDASPS